MAGTGRDVRLTRKQHDALRALAVTSTTREAAEQSGVSERTMRRWLQQDGFLTEYRAMSREANSQASSALMHAQLEAVAVLRAGLKAKSEATRVRAASRLLEIGLKVADDDLEERITGLERRAETWEQSANG